MRQNEGVLPVFRHSFRLSDSSSVFQAELMAIYQALLFLTQQDGPATAIIYCDSQAALLALDGEFIHSKIVRQVVELLNSLPGQVVLRWVKAHVGHSGNEQADSHAKMGCYRELPEEPTPFPRKLIRNTVLAKLRAVWGREWDEYPHARQTKHFCAGSNPKQAKEICGLNRFSLGRLIRVVTGHNGFNAHRHNVDNAVPSVCRLCNNGPESFLHFITTCSSLSLDRAQVLQKSFDTPCVWEVQEILEFSRLPAISDFMDRHGFYSTDGEGGAHN